MIDLTEWDSKQVSRWLEGMGLYQYSEDFRYHHVSGQTLCYMDHEDLIEVGVESLGHRMKLLMEVNKFLKRGNENVTTKTSGEVVKELADTKVQLKKMNDDFNRLRRDMLPAIRRFKESEPLPTPFGGPSPTHLHSSSGREHHSASSPITDGSLPPTELKARTSSRSGTVTPSAVSTLNRNLGMVNEIGDEETRIFHAHVPSARSPSVPGAPVSLSTAAEPFKSFFRVTMDDPCTKILPVVMKKYKIHDDPAYYRLLVSYGDRQRELRPDEKPLYVFKELQDAGERPVFMLRQVAQSSARTPSSRLPGGVI